MMQVPTVSREKNPIVEEEAITIPVLAEALVIGKRIVEQGGVRIVKTISTEEVTVEEPTIHHTAIVDRIAVNRLLDANETLPVTRTEGETMIIPIFEEVIVVEKRIRLTEELHIRQTQTEVVTPQSIMIQRELVSTEPIAVTDDLQLMQD